MKRKFALTLALASALALISALPVFPGEDQDHTCPHACKPGKFEMMHATGVNYCVNCALKNELNAEVDCVKSGHQTALKITKYISFCGEEKPEFNGKTYFYFVSEAAKPLRTAHLGETVTVSGRLYFDLPVIEVQEFKVQKPEEKKN
ncbi:MAG: hypothetical protein FJY65_11970 [Calditrichaeota bacterium]|nr:hypothetical protein [Calditrichota bacterium]